MVWLRIKDLENKIKNNQLSDEECLNYIFCNCVLYGLIMLDIEKHNPYYNNRWIVLTRALTYTLIAIWGLSLTFKTNKSGDATDYFKRLIAIKFVILLRVMIFLIVLVIITDLLGSVIFGLQSMKNFRNSLAEEWFILLLVIASEIALFLMINNSLKRINGKK